MEMLRDGYLKPCDAAEYLGTTERKLSLYRRSGLLKWCRFGKSYVYRKAWLDEFAETWRGYDLSNETAVKNAVTEKAWREKQERKHVLHI